MQHIYGKTKEAGCVAVHFFPQCEKLNRQRRSLMGIMASVHGKMDNVDQAISQAR